MYPIPANATRIRYLESTGTQYIDTGIVAGPSTRSETDIAVTWGSNTNYALSGCGNSRHVFGRGWTSAPRNDNFYIGLGDTNYDTGVLLGNLTGRHTYWIDAPLGKGGYDDTGFSVSATVTENAFTSLLLAQRLSNSATSIRGYMNAKLYGCRYYQSGVLVRDYIPVRVGQTGYLFDRVSGQLFGNAADNNAGFPTECLGPDTFQQGVIPTRMCVMGVRRKVMKFIRATGTYYPSREVTNNGSYLNTGINPDAQTSIEIICRVTPGSTFQHWAYLLGAQTANDNANTFSVRGLSTSQVSPPWRNYRWGHSSWQDFGITTDSWSGSSDWHAIVISRSGLVLDGVLYAATGTTNTSVPGKPIFIGCINRNGTAQNCIPLDIASLKIWNGSVLQFDGKPEVVNGVAGLKDSVSGSLFSSSLASNPYQLLQ